MLPFEHNSVQTRHRFELDARSNSTPVRTRCPFEYHFQKKTTMTNDFTFRERVALHFQVTLGMVAAEIYEFFKIKFPKNKTPVLNNFSKDQQEVLQVQFPLLKDDVIGRRYKEGVVPTGKHVFVTHGNSLFVWSRDGKWQTFCYDGDRTLIEVAVRMRNGKPRVIVLARNSAEEIIEAQTIDFDDEESQFERSDFFRVPLEYKETDSLVSDYCISEDGMYVLVKCRDEESRETLTLGNLETREVLFCKKFQEETDRDNCIHKIAFVGNDRFAFAKGGNINIFTIKKATEEPEQVISFEPNEKILSFDAHGNRLAICWQIRKNDYSRKLCIYKKDRKLKYRFDQYVDTCVPNPRLVYFSPDGKYLLISEGPCANQKEIIYDMTNMHDAFVPQLECLHPPYRWASRNRVYSKESDRLFRVVDMSERFKFYEKRNCPKYTK